jgi:hypothetical protein
LVTDTLNPQGANVREHAAANPRDFALKMVEKLRDGSQIIETPAPGKAISAPAP